MDNVREKLVELLESINAYAEENLGFDKASGGELIDFHGAEYIADHLIANGVTVQEWISVEDELPKEQGFYRVYHKNSKVICDRFYYKDCPNLFVNVKGDPITHWKPIDQPPKGE